MPFGFIKKMLIRIARKVLEGVMSQLLQQFNIIEDQALSPMRAMVQAVTNGVWRGEGADAFVEEVSSLMIPGVGRVGESISTMRNNIQFALDTMDRADEAVDQLVKSRLFDTFDFYR